MSFRVLILFSLLAHFLVNVPVTRAQSSERVKIAEGEHRVTTEGDLGAGPIEAEVFHFREFWTLWRTNDGFEVEGHRTFESPRGQLHDDRFIVKLAPNLQLLSEKEFGKLLFRSESGLLSCDLLPRLLRCDSGAKNPAQPVDLHVAMGRPYGFIWPLSAFSLAALTRAASVAEQPVAIQVVQLEQISERLPVLAIRSDGLIRYLGQESAPMVPNGAWHTKLYEITAASFGEMKLWISQQGLLLAAEKPNWPGSRMVLVKFTQFADF